MFIRLFSIYMYRNDVCSNLIIGHNLSIGHNTLSDKNSSNKIVEILAYRKNFVWRKILSVENFVQYFNSKVRQKSDKIVEISALCPKILSVEILFHKVYLNEYFISHSYSNAIDKKPCFEMSWPNLT